MVDDFTRECLALVPDTSWPGVRVAHELDEIIALRCKPNTCLSQNGAELTSTAILKLSQERSVEWHYIASGKPLTECLRRELHRSAQGQVSQRDALYLTDRRKSCA